VPASSIPAVSNVYSYSNAYFYLLANKLLSSLSVFHIVFDFSAGVYNYTLWLQVHGMHQVYLIELELQAAIQIVHVRLQVIN
jgi:hypothetical protein